MIARLGIDVGNSLTKFFRLPASSPPAKGSELEAWIEQMPSGEIDVLSYAALQSAALIELVSVNPQNAKPFVRRDLTAPGSFCQWTTKSLPIKNSYSNQATLGTDRPLAAWAAYRLSEGPVVVVDSGTALTVDVVNSKGEFLGGAIAPGLRTIQKSLGEAGAMLYQVEETGAVFPGSSTEDCLRLGSFKMFAGGLKELVSSALQIEPEAKVFVTGGDQSLVVNILADNSPQMISLIHLGLALLSWQREGDSD